MLRLIVDLFKDRLPDHFVRYVFPLDRTHEVARAMGSVVFDSGLNFSQRVDVAIQTLSVEPADFVFVNTVRMAAFSVAATKMGIKNCIYVHEMGDSFAKLVQTGFLTLDALEYPDTVLWACNKAKRDWEMVAGTRSRSFVLESCYSPKRFVVSDEIEQQKDYSAYFNKGPVVMSTGTVCLRKGFDRFVELAIAFSDVPFVWVGGFDINDPLQGGASIELAKKAPNLAITGNVADPQAILEQATIVLFLSREDPNPLTIHEGVFHGSNYVAVIDGLGEAILPLSTGAAVASYDLDLMSHVIRQSIELERSCGTDLLEFRSSQRKKRKKAFLPLVRTEDIFSKEARELLMGGVPGSDF
jgi:glycosyltransferase involved in cell wall biosynthesis